MRRVPRIALAVVFCLVAPALLAGPPGPVCDQAPTDVIYALNEIGIERSAAEDTRTVLTSGPDGCGAQTVSSRVNPAVTVPPYSMVVLWTPPACEGITKYSVEILIHYYPTGCVDPAYTETFKFTTVESRLVIPHADLGYFDPRWAAPAVIRVKAITSKTNDARGGRSPNASQNGPFSEPSTDHYFVDTNDD